MANQAPRKKDMWDYAPYIIIIIFCLIIGTWAGYVVEVTSSPKRGIQWLKALESMTDYINLPSFMAAFKALFTSTYVRVGAFWGALIGAMIFLYSTTKKEKRYHRKGVEHGSARWGTNEEKRSIADVNDFYNNAILASDIFLVIDRKKRDANAAEKEKHKHKKNISKTPTFILGSSGTGKSRFFVKPQTLPESEATISNPNRKVSVSAIANQKSKAKKIQAMLNLNMLILGGSGTGKSRFFVKPNIMQCNTSFVVTDPSGELLKSCGKMLERMGYDIKVFNIDDMRHSCNYNPFHYIYDCDGSVNENYVIKMINTFMENTKGEGQGGDPFWDDCTRLLLSAISFLIIEAAEADKKENAENNNDEPNFPLVLEFIHKAKVIEGKEEEQSDLDKAFELQRERLPNALSVQYYEEFKQAAGKTMQSILISTTTRLQYFKLEQVRNLVHTDNIGLDTLGDKKTALFIIIPSTDTTYNFLAAMMYTQLFDTLYGKAIKSPKGKLDYHVRFICDEFANTGKIPDFEKILATCRKFEISIQVILQNLSQLKRLYEKSWEEIPGNCDTTIFLGGKDQTNNEYIMKELGKETIDTLNINKTRSKNDSTAYNDGIMGRELMQLDELATMPNNECLVLVRGMRPFKTDKFDIINHERYFMLDEANPEENTYYLEKNVFTEAKTEVVYIGEEYLEDNTLPENLPHYTFRFIDSENQIITPVSELDKNYSAEINTLFSGIQTYSTAI